MAARPGTGRQQPRPILLAPKRYFNGLKKYLLRLLQTKQTQLLHSLLIRDVPDPPSSSQPSAGPSPVAPCLSCIDEPRTGQNTPEMFSLGHTRGGGSPTLSCCRHSSHSTPGYHWPCWNKASRDGKAILPCGTFLLQPLTCLCLTGASLGKHSFHLFKNSI